MVEYDTCTDKDRLVLQQAASLLEDPAYAENPLRYHLANLLDICTVQQEKLERLISISDGYHQLTRDKNLRQVKRLEKLAKISDFYQNNLFKLNTKMEQAALVDVLTGLHNRRYLMIELGKLMQKSDTHSKAFSLAMLDLDDFKDINDKYSHEIGDLALQAIAKTMQSSIRDNDLCGRWGGEEFLIVFPNSDINTATQIAQRILNRIVKLELPKIAKPPLPHITASIGITTYLAGESYMDTIDRADSALHKAKEGGKNTLVSLQ